MNGMRVDALTLRESRVRRWWPALVVLLATLLLATSAPAVLSAQAGESAPRAKKKPAANAVAVDSAASRAPAKAAPRVATKVAAKGAVKATATNKTTVAKAAAASAMPAGAKVLAPKRIAPAAAKAVDAVADAPGHRLAWSSPCFAHR